MISPKGISEKKTLINVKMKVKVFLRALAYKVKINDVNDDFFAARMAHLIQLLSVAFNLIINLEDNET